MFNPMSNTGTMTAAGDGPIEMARSLVEFQNEDGGRRCRRMRTPRRTRISTA